MRNALLLSVSLIFTVLLTVSFSSADENNNWQSCCASGCDYTWNQAYPDTIGGKTYYCCEPTGWQEGACECSNTGLGTPSVSPSPPVAGEQFYIYCPVDSDHIGADCIYANANGLSYQCDYVDWFYNRARFICPGLPAGNYMARCAATTGTGSNCCYAAKTVSYTIYPATQCDSGACCDTSTGTYKSAGTLCRAAEGACDMPEYCTGSSANCPSNSLRPSGYVCNYGSWTCQSDQSTRQRSVYTCIGTSATCPSTPSSTQTEDCGTPYCADSCSKVYTCSGGVCGTYTANCPANTVCTGAGVCGSGTACRTGSYECSGTCTVGRRQYRCDGSGNCNAFWQWTGTSSCNPFTCSGTSCSNTCEASCGADAACDGKQPGDSCGSGMECDSSCSCIVTDCPGYSTSSTCNADSDCTWCSGDGACKSASSVSCQPGQCNGDSQYCSNSCSWATCSGTNDNCYCSGGNCVGCSYGYTCSGYACVQDCPYGCWASCIDDNAPNPGEPKPWCFDRTAHSGYYCSAGTCCESNPVCCQTDNDCGTYPNCEDCITRDTSCGYDTCTADEKPVWSCSDGSCQYDCNYAIECVACGNGVCQPSGGEDCETCPSDCACTYPQCCQSGTCVAEDTCSGNNICSEGGWVPHCGDGIVNCGESCEIDQTQNGGCQVCNVNCDGWADVTDGTDCGDCMECQTGVCTSACQSAESSCECIADSCIDCSDYYGTDCGYDICEDSESPSWSCSGSSCIYDCDYDPACVEPVMEVINYDIIQISEIESSFTVDWNVTYTPPAQRDVAVECVLNCDQEAEDCSAAEKCLAYPTVLASGDIGGCAVANPTLLPKKIYGEDEFFSCKMYDPSYPEHPYYRKVIYGSLDFTLSTAAVSVTVGESFRLPVNIRNNGLISDSYHVVVEPLEASAQYVTVENGDVYTETSTTNETVTVYPRVTILVARPVTLGVTITSEANPLVNEYREIQLDGGAVSMPGIGLFGLLQIIVLAAALLFVSKSF